AGVAGISASIQSALVQLGFHRGGVPGRDAECDVTETRRLYDGRVRRLASASAAAPANDRIADVADLHLVLAAGIHARRPAEQRRVERDRRFVVRAFE